MCAKTIYIAKNNTSQNAEYVLDKLEEMIFSLDEIPERGNYPPELSHHGMREFREVMFKFYRAIYEISGNKVIVYLCVDDSFWSTLLAGLHHR